MNCYVCGSGLNNIVDSYPFNSKALGEVLVPEVSYYKCDACGETVISPAEAVRVHEFVKHLEDAAIASLQVSEFITLNDVAQLLGITKQAVSKNSRISRGLIYSITINGKKLFYRQSVLAFKETGDGRISLSARTPLPEASEWTASKVISNVITLPVFRCRHRESTAFGNWNTEREVFTHAI